MKKTIIIFLLICTSILAQGISDSFIDVTAHSEVKAPAERITFQITIEAMNSSAISAFNELKKIEKKFVPLLEKYNIPDSSIVFSPSEMRRGRITENREEYHASERAVIILDNIEKYEQFQMDLIDAGIYSFHTRFSTNNTGELKERGFEEALAAAEKDAKLLCEKAGRKLGKIISIESRSNNVYGMNNRELLLSPSGSGLIDIPQYVTLQTNLQVRYELK